MVKIGTIYKRVPCANCGALIAINANHQHKCEITRVIAKRRVQQAIARGDLIPATRCALCDAKPRTGRRLDAHHWHGYDKEHVLDVQWLCKSCHARVHRVPMFTHAQRVANGLLGAKKRWQS